MPENTFVICWSFMKHYNYVNDAIAYEKELKKWRREKKLKLISGFNPDWKTLNAELLGKWPPAEDELFHRKDV